MQLECQLVFSGLCCDNSTDYDDSRRRNSKLEQAIGDFFYSLTPTTTSISCGAITAWSILDSERRPAAARVQTRLGDSPMQLTAATPKTMRLFATLRRGKRQSKINPTLLVAEPKPAFFYDSDSKSSVVARDLADSYNILCAGTLLILEDFVFNFLTLLRNSTAFLGRIAEKCTKISPSTAGSRINPKPLLSLNHFTIPWPLPFQIHCIHLCWIAEAFGSKLCNAN